MICLFKYHDRGLLYYDKKFKVVGGLICLLTIVLIISSCSSVTLNEIGQDYDELEDD